MTTIEKNRLIAVFMNYEILGEYCDPFGSEDVTPLPYLIYMFDDWNELMPVVDLCRERQMFGSQHLIDKIDAAILLNDNKEGVYNAVVEFIEWYNQLTSTGEHTWGQVKGQVHDASGITNPEQHMWYKENGIFYPIIK